MKIGIISDVHSNYRAFRACLDYFAKEQVDYYLLLGDYISDTPCPDKVMEILYSLQKEQRVYAVRGNREDYFLEDRAADKGWRKGSPSGNLLYTKERLTERDYRFFESLPVSGSICLEGYPSITFCHIFPSVLRTASTDRHSLRKQRSCRPR